MQPNKPNAPLSVRKFEVITPNGRVHRFPRSCGCSEQLGREAAFGTGVAACGCVDMSSRKGRIELV